MTTPVASPFLLAQAGEARFDRRSRYHGLPWRETTRADGEVVAYVSRRFIPPPERYAQTTPHVVAEGDRPDVLAARSIGAPQLDWRIADANRSFDPNQLVAVPGATLRIPQDSGGGQDG